MHNIVDIKENDFVKYFKNVFQVRSVKKLSNGGCQIHYYFRTSKNKNGKLYTNDVYTIDVSYLVDNLKKASPEEVSLLLLRIKKYNSGYKITSQNGIENNPGLNEEDCIIYLKSRGYLVSKKL